MNSLTLDPSDPAMQTLVADWQDGQEYDLTIRVKQTTPFNFDVVTAAESEPIIEEEAAPVAEKTSPVVAIIAAGKRKRGAAAMV